MEGWVLVAGAVFNFPTWEKIVIGIVLATIIVTLRVWLWRRSKAKGRRRENDDQDTNGPES